MKSKLIHYAKEILLFIFVMTILANLISLYKSSDLNSGTLALNEVTLIDNKSYIFTQEKPVLIHFWATWCPTCKVEASNIEFISKYFDVVTIAVNSGSKDELIDYLLENDLRFNVLNDSNSYYSQEFNVAAFPTTFIYDENKNLVFSEVGYTSTIGLFLRMWWASF
ncbi:MAG: redoxin domain-containing protein [Campylobacterota bacterium]|nr:redoxin domain-containing protein [Campylobacterota bacterium]